MVSGNLSKARAKAVADALVRHLKSLRGLFYFLKPLPTESFSDFLFNSLCFYLSFTVFNKREPNS